MIHFFLNEMKFKKNDWIFDKLAKVTNISRGDENLVWYKFTKTKVLSDKTVQ